MALVSMADLKRRSLTKADHLNSGFVSDQELEDLVNESYGEYVDLIEDEVGPEFLARSFTLPTVAGQTTYVVGDGTTHPYMYRLLSVRMPYLNMMWPIEYGSYLDVQRPDAGLGFISPGGVKYHMTGLDQDTSARTVTFWPAPRAVHQMEIRYVPMLPTLAEDSMPEDSIQGFIGWDEYVVLTTAMKILEKEESDVAALEKRRDRLVLRIQQAVIRANAGRTEAVTDSSTMVRPSIRDLPFWDR